MRYWDFRVAEDASPSGKHASFSRRYGFLADFFKTGETDRSVRGIYFDVLFLKKSLLSVNFDFEKRCCG